LLFWREQPVFARDVPRVLRQPIGTKNLSANRPDEPPLGSFRTAEQLEESF
jgi:hypothetical protein